MSRLLQAVALAVAVPFFFSHPSPAMIADRPFFSFPCFLLAKLRTEERFHDFASCDHWVLHPLCKALNRYCMLNRYL